MESESLVYGCIRDWSGHDTAQSHVRRARNREVLARLPVGDGPLLGGDIFSLPDPVTDGVTHSQVIHFGASYQAVEYEWGLWIQQFESLLKQLYWTSAVVHLETELNGTHTFRWESDNGQHSPHEGELRVRCAWEREGGLRG